MLVQTAKQLTFVQSENKQKMCKQLKSLHLINNNHNFGLTREFMHFVDMRCCNKIRAKYAYEVIFFFWKNNNHFHAIFYFPQTESGKMNFLI